MNSRYSARPCPPTADGRPRWEIWDRIQQRSIESVIAADAEAIVRERVAVMNGDDNEEDR